MCRPRPVGAGPDRAARSREPTGRDGRAEETPVVVPSTPTSRPGTCPGTDRGGTPLPSQIDALVGPPSSRQIRTLAQRAASLCGRRHRASDVRQRTIGVWVSTLFQPVRIPSEMILKRSSKVCGVLIEARNFLNSALVREQETRGVDPRQQLVSVTPPRTDGLQGPVQVPITTVGREWVVVSGVDELHDLLCARRLSEHELRPILVDKDEIGCGEPTATTRVRLCCIERTRHVAPIPLRPGASEDRALIVPSW